MPVITTRFLGRSRGHGGDDDGCFRMGDDGAERQSLRRAETNECFSAEEHTTG